MSLVISCGALHELKLTSEFPVKETPPSLPEPQNLTVKRLYFVVNDGYVHGVYSAIYRIYTNGSDLEEVIGDEFLESGLIATSVAILPSYDDNSTGYLYVSTSRTIYNHGTEGCIIYRCPLDDIANNSRRETVVHINGSKILALALDMVDVTYTDEPVEEGWGRWYWYLLIGLGGLFVISLAFMAFKDILKLCSRQNNSIQAEDEQRSPEAFTSESYKQEHYRGYYPPAQPLPYEQQQPLIDGQSYIASPNNSLNQQFMNDS